MNEKEMTGMACERFMSLLDKYMDDELTMEEEAFMAAHAKNCEACDREYKMTAMIRETIKRVDDDITVPLKAQSAWRTAVRREMAGKKRSRFVKALSTIAAAFIVLVGTTAFMRGSGALPPRETNPQPLLMNSRLAGALESAQDDLVVMMDFDVNDNSAAKPMYMVIEADGEAAEDADCEAESIAPYADEQLIRSAWRTAESKDIEADYKMLCQLTEEYEGYVASTSTSYDPDLMSATVLARVPDEFLDEYMTALENIGRTVSVTTSSESAALQYYEVDARIQTKVQTANRLNELIANADAAEAVDIEKRLDELYNEIDELQRLVRARDNDVRYAKVSVSLYEAAAPEAPLPINSTAARASSGFGASLKAMGRFFEDMFVSLAVIAPVVLALAAVVIVIIGAKCIYNKTQKSYTKKE